MRDRLPQLALARLVHLPDDRVVADVLLDRVLERLSHGCGHPHRPAVRRHAAWRCAPAGCSGASSSPGTTGFLVSTLSQGLLACVERAQRVLDDAILERVERDHDQPRAIRGAAARRSRGSGRGPRARGSPRCAAPGTCASRDRSAGSPRRGIDAPDDRRQPAGRGDRLRRRALATIARAIRREKRSSPYLKMASARSRSDELATRSAARLAARSDPCACRAARRAGS